MNRLRAFRRCVARMAYVLAMISVSFIMPSAMASDELPKQVVFVGDTWCPYNCAETEEKKGALVELLIEILQRENIDLEYRVLPWTRALKDVSAGRIDGIIGAGKADQQYAALTDKPWLHAELAALTHKEAGFRWNGIEGLLGKSVVVIANYEYAEPLPAWLAANPSAVRYLHGENAFKQAVQMVLHRRQDIFFSSYPALHRHLHSAGLTESLQVHRTGFKTPIFMAVTKHKPYSEKLLRVINSGFDRAVKNGKVAKLKAYYEL